MLTKYDILSESLGYQMEGTTKEGFLTAKAMKVGETHSISRENHKQVGLWWSDNAEKYIVCIMLSKGYTIKHLFNSIIPARKKFIELARTLLTQGK